MTDTLITIAAIALLFVGLPLFLLWLRDRQGILGWLVEKSLGILALLFGLCIMAWYVYNQFHPTPQYQRAYHGPATLAVPLGLISIGFGWLFCARRGKRQG